MLYNIFQMEQNYAFITIIMIIFTIKYGYTTKSFIPKVFNIDQQYVYYLMGEQNNKWNIIITFGATVI